MLLSQHREPFNGDDWLFEPKWDGWRCIAAAQGGRARLLSRNANDITARFPGVANALERLPGGTVIDGELVVLDADAALDEAQRIGQRHEGVGRHLHPARVRAVAGAAVDYRALFAESTSLPSR